MATTERDPRLNYEPMTTMLNIQSMEGNNNGEWTIRGSGVGCLSPVCLSVCLPCSYTSNHPCNCHLYVIYELNSLGRKSRNHICTLFVFLVVWEFDRSTDTERCVSGRIYWMVYLTWYCCEAAGKQASKQSCSQHNNHVNLTPEIQFIYLSVAYFANRIYYYFWASGECHSIG